MGKQFICCITTCFCLFVRCREYKIAASGGNLDLCKAKKRKPPDYSIERVTDSFEGAIQSKLGIKTAGYTIELFYPLLKAKNCIITRLI